MSRVPADSATGGSGARVALGLLLVLVGGAVSCGDGPSGPDPADVARVEVSSERDTLTWLGQTAALHAEAFDASGRLLEGADVSWSSNDTLVAAVDDDGEVTARSDGTATIRASAGGASGAAHVSVVQAPTDLDAVSGDGQEAPVGTELAEPAVVEVRDRGGSPVPGVAVEWTASDGGEVSVDAGEPEESRVGVTDEAGRAAAAWRLGGTTGEQSLTANAGGLPALAFTAAAGPEVVASVEISPPADTLGWIGETLRLSVEVVGSAGGSLPDDEVVWRSDDTLVATVDTFGTVVARSNGGAAVRASLGAFADTARLLVRQRPAGMEVVSGDGQVGTVGLELPEPLEVRVADAGGTGVADVPLTWSVTAGGGALGEPDDRTRTDGTARAVWTLGGSAGVQAVDVAADGVDEPLHVTARAETDDAGELSVESVLPAPLVEGGVGTVTGTGLGGRPDDYDVTVDGAPAVVLSTAGGSLEFRVPTFRCSPARDVTVAVSRTGGGADEALRPLHPPRIDSLDPGRFLLYRDPAGFCFYMEPEEEPATYLIGVQSLTEAPSAVTPALLFAGTGLDEPSTAPLREERFEGAPAAPRTERPGPEGPVAAGRSAGARAAGPAPAPGGDRRALPISRADLEAHRRAEGERRRYERELVDALGGPEGVRARTEPARPERAAPAAPPEAGDTLQVRVPRSCSSYDDVTAVVRAVGERGVWMEDVDNPPGGFGASDFDALSRTFDDEIHPTNEAYFGSPTDLDENGRVAVLVTKEVNRLPGVLGFVFGVDLLARADCPASNEGEIFYGLAPDPDGLHGRGWSTDEVRALYPNLVAHEVTHIIQFARRIHLEPAPLQPTWVTEGQATFAEEAVGFSLLGLEPRSNYGGSVWEAASPWFDDLFTDLALYFGFESSTTRVAGAPHECSWLGRPDEGNASPCLGAFRLPYGVPALFFRWLLDHHGGGHPDGQQAMMRAMVDDPATGFAMVESVVGEDIDRLLALWAMALYADDAWFSGGLATMPSWDLPDLFSLFHATASLRPDQLPTLDGGSKEIDVAAGSTAYFLLQTGTRPYSAVGSATPLRADLPDHMRYWVLRLR